jgi:hypothetical protein
MMPNFKNLYGDLRSHIIQLKRLGDALIQAMPMRQSYPKFVKDLLSAYRFTVHQVAGTFYNIKKQIKKSSVHSNPPRIPIEALENIFMSLRNSAEEAAYLAERAEFRNARDARALRTDASRLALFAHQAAGILEYEAKIRGVWSAKWIKELELDKWL